MSFYEQSCYCINCESVDCKGSCCQPPGPIFWTFALVVVFLAFGCLSMSIKTSIDQHERVAIILRDNPKLTVYEAEQIEQEQARRDRYLKSIKGETR